MDWLQGAGVNGIITNHFYLLGSHWNIILLLSAEMFKALTDWIQFINTFIYDSLIHFLKYDCLLFMV
jgi:hypothetical protein